MRRLTLTNRSDSPRTIEVTSYAEVVLAPPSQDLSHPAFSNLFVQTELLPNRQAILCNRRPRSAEERPPWMMHLMTVRGTTVGEVSFETNRLKFIGRDRTLAAPAAMEGTAQLSNSHGPVLDPVVCIRRVIRLQGKETVYVDLITGIAETSEAIRTLADKYSDPRLADRVFELSWTHSQVLLRQLNATEADAQAYGRLASSVFYASALRRAKASVLTRNRRGQSGLWGYGISGDLPIVLLRIRDRERIELVSQAVQAHAYWRLKGLAVDLVIWNEDDSSYRQMLQDAIMDRIAASPEATLVDKPGGIFVRRGELMSEEDRALLQTVARVVLLDDAGTLPEQIERRGRTEVSISALKPLRRPLTPSMVPELPPRDLAFFNGLGGFSRDGREYVTLLTPGKTTPAPWVNVIANPQFGTVVSESGSVYTWSENSHEFRLTPWNNDPVSDTNGEAIYIRDEETGRFWSPSPLPARGYNSYVARHGFGYSIFEYTEDGLTTELSLYVATDAPVKFARLRITNRSGRQRQLSVTGYWEWVLGEMRDKTLMHVVTELDPVSGALFARNAYSADFADRVAFADCSEPLRTVTGDRTEFLGRNGTPANPAALGRIRLSGRVGAGLDPCAAMQVQVALEDGQEKEVVFYLGAAHNEDQARQLLQRFRGAGNAYRALEGVWHYWSRALGAVYFETPDPAVNFLVNGWLVYQTLACRMWARTGFYQSGGAFGFRDQLQDAMALVHAEPGLLREQLLRAAAHQFREGDVQHWWHPPVGRGVRTQFSDDFLWLPCAVCRYVLTTGDTGVLDERVPFLRTRLLRPEEESNYDLPHLRRCRNTLRPLRPRDQQRSALRRTRFAIDGLRRLERRHEPGRPARQGRERLARVLPVRRAHPVRGIAARRRGRCRHCRSLHGRSGPAARQHRRTRLGRRMVPPSVFRRRHAARLRYQCGVPDRLTFAELVGPLRCRHAGTVGGGHGERRPPPRPPRNPVDPASGTALRQVEPQPRLHQGVRPRCARKWRPVHARGHLDGDGLRGDGRSEASVGTLYAHQPGDSRRESRGDRRLSGRAVRGGRRRLCRAAAHGPRRLDLVHRLGRLDVSAHHRITSGIAVGRGQTSLRAPCLALRAGPLNSRSTTAIAKPFTTSPCETVAAACAVEAGSRRWQRAARQMCAAGR